MMQLLLLTPHTLQEWLRAVWSRNDVAAAVAVAVAATSASADDGRTMRLAIHRSSNTCAQALIGQ